MLYVLLDILLRRVTYVVLAITQVEEMFALLAARLFPNAINAHLILYAQYVLLVIKEISAIHVLQLIINQIVHLHLLLAVLV